MQLDAVLAEPADSEAAVATVAGQRQALAAIPDGRRAGRRSNGSSDAGVTPDAEGSAPAELPRQRGRGPSSGLTKQDFEALARFRFGIRRYLRLREETVRDRGLTPRQYQLLLALEGFPGREGATVGELAERLPLRHHSTVELINRAQAQELVSRSQDPEDARVVRVELTGVGEDVLGRLSWPHRLELDRMGTVLTAPNWRNEQ
ncbi:MarR family winged helix-turn-helix transcriptional regulator [Pseudonocardia kujensis]|uniref:MarR family winged helix-turn-helix transcriptional regulator n=1 Tax=Pseudonocardia kujensis TaxID=1128675 RepID=UPI001E2B8BB0|nr:helix-turn-helix domain-containing protein [Pseudonocardia kujensis]MCE0762471.1 MarR family winged helix-turn-helix transcriptional regulator [Pseudonocardia kujensis]